MDRETKRAYQLVQLRIIEHLDRLETAQKSKVKISSKDVDAIKKWRRFGAAFAWDPLVFKEVLEEPFMSDAQLIRTLRNGEENLMKRWGYIKGIPLHHIIADRTGGDLGIRTPIDIWEDTKKRIFDLTGAKPGDGTANLNAAGAFDELWHQGRLGAKGTVFAEAGLIRPEDFPYLHRAGQNLAEKLGKDPKIVQATAKEQAELLLPSIKQQQERYQQVLNSAQYKNQLKAFSLFPEFKDLSKASLLEIEEIERSTRKTPIPSIYARAGFLIYDPVQALTEFLSSDEGQNWYAKTTAERLSKGLAPLNPFETIQRQEFGAGLGTQAYEQLKDFVKKNAAGEIIGGLYSIMLDPEMRKAVEAGDINTITSTLTRDVVLGGIGQKVSENLMKLLPQKAATVVGSVAPALQAAAPIAAVSQLKGSVDPMVTQREAVRRLQQGSTADIKRKQYLPQAYGAQGPQLDPTTGKAVTEPQPLISINPEAERRAQEARQRGGRLSFGFGGVKVTLPEFGLSEMLGVN